MTGYEIHRARTGRTVKSMSPEEIADDELVVNWIKSLSGHSIRKNKGEIRFHQLVKDVPIVKERELILFRGRDDIKSDPTLNDFGPPPATSTKANRYNKAKHPFLYLCSSKQGVLMELKNHKKVIKRIYCQQFCLPINGLNIVDFSRNDINNFLSHAFDRAEHDDTYSFSQVLAKIVMKCGFDGMVVPGVRATGVNDRYKNVVLFTHDKWITWVDKRYKPELIYDAGISPK